jgi:purine catabolism regulator
MLTVGSLTSECGLELVAGESRADTSIRWVHISEIADPTPWLSGGELLLTTGIQLGDAAAQERLVDLLAEGKAAGLGFGTGFGHDGIPEALVAAARTAELPLFEVPYEMPFIAITERAFRRLVNEQYDVLERGTRVHERLERLVIEGRGLQEVTADLAGAIDGAAVILDGLGVEVARHPVRGGPGAAAVEAVAAQLTALLEESPAASFEPAEPELAGRSLVVPVPGRRGAEPVGWLLAVAEGESLGDFERLIARQAALVVGMELMRERIVRETERRLAGDLLSDALSGRLDAEELQGRLRPFGIGANAAVAVYDVGDPAASEAVLEASLAAQSVPAVVATTSAAGRPLLCAILDPGEGDPLAIAASGRSDLLFRDRNVRAAVSRLMGVGSLRRAFHEARCALEATSLANGSAPEVASHRDLGAFTLLLALQDDEALRLYSEGLLEPIERGEGEYGGELLRSLEAFIENNGNWERAARQLYCHRHTLRYRIRKIEELTGRDLSRATDRIELWLALRARELVR